MFTVFGVVDVVWLWFLLHTCKVILAVLTKKHAPGGDLIRVDLIRFPGSIPGAI